MEHLFAKYDKPDLLDEQCVLVSLSKMSQVVRGVFDGRRVYVKTYFDYGGAQGLVAAGRELHALDALQTSGCVPELVRVAPLVYRGVHAVQIVLSDGGVCLREEFSGRGRGFITDWLRSNAAAVVKLMAALSDAGIVHRDLAPDNLVFDGEVLRAIDFELSQDVRDTVDTIDRPLCSLGERFDLVLFLGCAYTMQRFELWEAKPVTFSDKLAVYSTWIADARTQLDELRERLDIDSVLADSLLGDNYFESHQVRARYHFPRWMSSVDDARHYNLVR